MDWGDTAEQAAFRAEVREFVEARLPERYKHDPFDSGEHFVQWVFDRYSEEPELRDETDGFTDGEEEPSDDLDAAPEEAAV